MVLLRCPNCDHGNDLHTSIDAMPRVPHDGDMSLCIACGWWGIFEAGTIRSPDAVELLAINHNPDCQRAMRTWTILNGAMRGTQ
jgi:hypothetical protein